jgi:hypothetical protein
VRWKILVKALCSTAEWRDAIIIIRMCHNMFWHFFHCDCRNQLDDLPAQIVIFRKQWLTWILIGIEYVYQWLISFVSLP